MLRLAVCGCNGRMGKALVNAIQENAHVVLSGVTIAPGSTLADQSLADIATDDLEKIIDKVDVVIDFTTPQASLKHVEICHRYGKKIVIGTTGITSDEKKIIEKASKDIAIVLAPNTGIGINICLQLLPQVAKMIGLDADITIIEAHHRNKVDAPSGTALKMGEEIAQGLPPHHKDIAYSSIRAGDIVGEHTALFAIQGERIEITHRATDRSIFAHGAIRAAQWLASKTSGLYGMREVLAL